MSKPADTDTITAVNKIVLRCKFQDWLTTRARLGATGKDLATRRELWNKFEQGRLIVVKRR